MSIHIGAKSGEIAETVLIAGDPLRAKFIAESMFENSVCYNQVRGMLGYTGHYNGKRISVQGTGMGIPSTAIYITELVKEYEVKNIIRVGTCGSLHADLGIGQVIMASGACSDSQVNKLHFNQMDFAPIASFDLLINAWSVANEKKIPVRVGNVFSSDTFYNPDQEYWKIWAAHEVLGIEMETSVLYTLSARHHFKALSLLSVSDNLVTGVLSSAAERETTFMDMVKIALAIA